MEEKLTETAREGRDSQGRWLPGVSGNPEGDKPDTPEQKIVRKATKQLIKEYQEKLAEALVKVEPVLVAKALEGDVGAIKELHDRAMGKAPQKLEMEGSIETKQDLTELKEITDKLNAIYRGAGESGNGRKPGPVDDKA